MNIYNVIAKKNQHIILLASDDDVSFYSCALTVLHCRLFFISLRQTQFGTQGDFAHMMTPRTMIKTTGGTATVLLLLLLPLLLLLLLLLPRIYRISPQHQYDQNTSTITDTKDAAAMHLTYFRLDY